MVPQQPRHVGHATLELLMADWSVPILRALMVGPRRPSELEARLPDIPHAALMRRLGELQSLRLAEREREVALNPVTRYILTPAGRTILLVATAAERWELSWSSVQAHGMEGLRHVADEHTREILLALAPAPATPGSLERDVALTRSPLRRRLGELAGCRILERDGTANHATYALTDSARELMLVSVAAARWEWEWNPPKRTPAAANIARGLHMLAPRAQVPADLSGVCALHVDDGANDGPTVHLTVDGRRVSAIADPEEPARAGCHGSQRAWCQGLLLGDWDGIRSTGDRALMAAVLASITVAFVS